MNKLQTLLDEWDDHLGAQTFSEAVDLIHELRIEIAARDTVIKVLHDDIKYYERLNDI